MTVCNDVDAVGAAGDVFRITGRQIFHQGNGERLISGANWVLVRIAIGGAEVQIAEPSVASLFAISKFSLLAFLPAVLQECLALFAGRWRIERRRDNLGEGGECGWFLCLNDGLVRARVDQTRLRWRTRGLGLERLASSPNSSQGGSKGQYKDLHIGRIRHWMLKSGSSKSITREVVEVQRLQMVGWFGRGGGGGGGATALERRRGGQIYVRREGALGGCG